MSDTLVVFGTTYNNVAGFKATDSSDNTQTYIRPTGTKQIIENGTGIDVAEYAAVDVNVPSGGDPDETFNKLLNNQLTTISSDISGALKGGTFYGCSNLLSADFPNVTDIKNMAFQNCSNLAQINIPKCRYVRGSGLRGTKLTYVVFPLECGFEAQSLGYNSSLIGLDTVGRSSGATFEGGCFENDSNLSIIVLRHASHVAQLNAVNIFNNTPFASGKAGGTLYVPASMISSYQAASNWSTILGYATNQIKSIESTATDPNAPVDLTTHYIDGSLIPT